jgi:predicted ATPase
VPLAPVSDPAEIVPTIAEALGLALTGNSELVTQLLAYLRDQSLLLVLDNLEHLLNRESSTADLVRRMLVQACQSPAHVRRTPPPCHARRSAGRG